MTDTSDLAAALSRAIEGDVRLDPVSRRLYSTDASIYEIEPIGVILPRSTQDVVQAVAVASERRLPLLPRGGGTSLAGQSVGACLQVDFSRYMNQVLEIDDTGRWVRLQPGVVLDELNAILSPRGFQFGPDVATSSRANLGGMIGNNSCGARSLVYGKTVDHVLELTVVLADGRVAVLGPVDDPERTRRASRAGVEGRAYSEVHRVVAEYGAEVDARYPRIMRRVSGYNLDAFVPARVGPDAPFDLTKIVVGSEGTLCSVVEAKVAIVPKPRCTAVVACHFADLVESMEATLTALEVGPVAVEVIDKLLLDQTRGQLECAPRRAFLQGDPEAILFVELYGESAEELGAVADDLERRLRGAGQGYAYVRAMHSAEQRQMWDLRKAGLGLLMRMRGDAKPQPGVEDTGVPVQILPEYVRRVRGLMADHGLEAEYYGHASVGVIHIRPVIDLKRPEGVGRLRSLEEAMGDLVLEYGGTMCAEHGDGLARSEWIPKMFGPRIVRAFEEVKAAFDPVGLMNPGKIVRPPRMDESLRYGDGYRDAEVQTFFRYEEAGTFQQAVELCSGVGHCRKKLVGTMCPSYMATLEEADSTRGRANALRAALTGRLPGGLTGEALHGVMDLCLECKACKAECPSSVDMAKLKYEFLALYHGAHGYPLRSRVFANIDALNRWMAPVATVANAILRSAPNRWLLDLVLGIDRRRRMPALARQRFSTWFRRRGPAAPGAAGTVVFFHDTFTEYNEPQVGRAAVSLLEAAGFRVVLHEGTRPCCGRPLISKGFLAQARQRAASNARALAPYAERGWPIVGVEPSCVLTFRDDYLDLVPPADAPAARAVAGNIHLLDEFLDRVLAQGRRIAFTDDARHILLHGHCHQKALVGTGHTLAVLSAPPNFTVEEIPSGCCGMAGSFGYEREHYEVSMKVGGPRLFDRIAAAGHDTAVAAPGTSCRHQIADATGRTARHWAEILAEALPGCATDR